MTQSSLLADLFLPHIKEAERVHLSHLLDLEAQLGSLWSAARASWPEIHVPADEFFRFLARRIDASSLTTLETLREGDLYLLCAYVQGVPGVARLFEAHYFRPVASTLRKLRVQPDMIEDVCQVLRARLLLDRVTDPDRRHYMGIGELVSWLCICAVREAGRRREKRERDIDFDELVVNDLTAQHQDEHELAYLKQLYRRDFKEAFQSALAELTPQERNVLRHNTLAGLNIAEIGAIYGVHRATVARWIAHAREVLLQKTREHLSRKIRMSLEDLDSVYRLIESQMEISLRRCLDDGA